MKTGDFVHVKTVEKVNIPAKKVVIARVNGRVEEWQREI
jgi:hypothetical protein